jgi:hypothetical protein
MPEQADNSGNSTIVITSNRRNVLIKGILLRQVNCRNYGVGTGTATTDCSISEANGAGVSEGMVGTSIAGGVGTETATTPDESSTFTEADPATRTMLLTRTKPAMRITIHGTLALRRNWRLFE